MRDGKALQAGTSHMLGQNFAQAAGIKFLDKDNQQKAPYGTSWGFSTRMVGAVIMAHGDDSGLVLPPNVAPTQLVIVPIFRSDEERATVAAAVETLEKSLTDVQTASGPLRFKTDWRDEKPGFKYNHWELRGVPFRLEIGPRDVAAEPGRAGPARRSRQADRSGSTRSPRSCPSCWPTTRQMLFQRARRLPRGEHALRRHVRRVQGDPRQGGRLPDGAVVRRRRVREADQRRHGRDDPRHPVRLARRGRASA